MPLPTEVPDSADDSHSLGQDRLSWWPNARVSRQRIRELDLCRTPLGGNGATRRFSVADRAAPFTISYAPRLPRLVRKPPWSVSACP